MDSRSDLPDPFGRFRIVRKLGEGGMGAVYLATDSRLGCRIALKVPFDRSGQALERFRREAELAQRVHHPYVCPVYEVGQVNGVHYLTMPFVDGVPLDRLSGPDQPWRARRAAELIRRLALGLEALHDRGVLHRDLKPHNVMVRGEDEPMLMDFGLARDLDNRGRRLTGTGVILGTLSYLAPEQVEGDIDALGPATDVYGLGVLLYELLTGCLPFVAETMAALFRKILQDEPPSPASVQPDLDRRLERVCLRMLSKQPGSRFARMGEVERELARFLSSSAREDEDEKRSRIPSTHDVDSWTDGSAPSTDVLGDLGSLSALREIDLHGREDVSDAVIARLQGLVNLCTLDLSGCNRLTDAGLAYLEGLPALTTLKLRNCEWLTDDGVAHLARIPALQDLDLTSCRVTERGLGQLQAVVSLRRLLLRDCGVPDAALARLGALASLTELNLSGSRILTGVGLASLAALTALERLDLSGCTAVTDAGLFHLGEIASLAWLDLSGCKGVTDVGLACLGQLASLHTLTLRWCERITDAGIPHLLGFAVLCDLNLRGCSGITESGLGRLAGLSVLEGLDLGQCDVSDEVLARLRDLVRLRKLNLCWCVRITDAGLVHLGEMRLLRELDLRGIKATDAGVANLALLSCLEQLSLWSCHSLTDAGVSHLASLTSLKGLDLSDCQVTDAGLARLRGLTSLRTLKLWGCRGPIDRGVAELQQALPQCAIEQGY
jgi:serine/threonine protein kinase